VGNPTGSILFDSAFTIIWVVGICNAINFFDNLDGGASGTVAITSIAIAILALGGDQFLIAALATVTAGATLGFLVWNKSPAKIYMGDAGSLFLGVLIATLTIRLDFNPASEGVSFFIPMCLLAIPILDTAIAVFSRIRRHVSPFQGGQDHLSHRLIRSGLSKKGAATALWGLSGSFSLVAIFTQSVSLMAGRYLLCAAGVTWLILFVWFFCTTDS
jgi:UDP-GlcNAc:undecaprenyl-phosphate GlcNAc-1-phosphate transferase